MGAAHGRGGAFRAGFQPPRAGSRHVKASQPFTPSLSKEGNSLGASLIYVALVVVRSRSGDR
jgi:hypothetical protein